MIRFRDGSRVIASCRARNVLFNDVTVASGFLSRLKGLLGRDGLGSGEGLLIVPCDSIHMFFMKFPIDAIFMDERGTILRIYRNLGKWRITPVVRDAWMVLEVSAGSAQNLEPGDVLEFEQPSGDNTHL